MTDLDKLQNKYDTVRLWSEEAGERIGIKFDAHVLYQVINATNTVDASNLGGASGEGITVTVSNVGDIFGELNEALDSYNIPEDERYFAFTPLFRNFLWRYIAGKESLLGDRTGETGNIGRYAGMKLYLSNNVTGESRWTPADNPTNNDTITIEGVTFTFVSSIGSAAGNVLIGANTEATIANLVALINAGGVGDNINNVSLSLANQRAVQNWVAVNGNSYFVVRVKGTPSLTVTGSDSNDIWGSAYKIQLLMAGRKNAIDAAIQTKGMQGIIDTQMASTVSAGKRGTNVMPLLCGGVKVFNLGKDELVMLKVRSDS